MGKLDKFLSQNYYCEKGTTEQKSRVGLRKSIERILIIGGIISTTLGFGNAIRSCNELDYNRIETEKKHNVEGGVSLGIGFLGFTALVIGGGFRNGRKQFERQGFLDDEYFGGGGGTDRRSNILDISYKNN